MSDLCDVGDESLHDSSRNGGTITKVVIEMGGLTKAVSQLGGRIATDNSDAGAALVQYRPPENSPLTLTVISRISV